MILSFCSNCLFESICNRDEKEQINGWCQYWMPNEDLTGEAIK